MSVVSAVEITIMLLYCIHSTAILPNAILEPIYSEKITLKNKMQRYSLT